MLVVTLGRQLTQRRSLSEVRENVEYLANLPRKIAFAFHSIEIEEPVEQGLLWYYRGIIRYTEKEHQKPERLEKDRNIILDRIRRAGDSRTALGTGAVADRGGSIKERNRWRGQ